jgi:ketosteroid isomerase-like protein
MTYQLDDAARRMRAHRVVDRLHQALLAHDMTAFADQWAPDGRMEFPFAPPGWPTLRSREEVRAYLRPYTESVDIRGIRHQTRHETTDPDTLILEWGVEGVALATGRPYAVDYVGVLKVGAEGIESYRDYWSALAAGHALGRLGEMVTAIQGQEVAQ